MRPKCDTYVGVRAGLHVRYKQEQDRQNSTKVLLRPFKVIGNALYDKSCNDFKDKKEKKTLA